MAPVSELHTKPAAPARMRGFVRPHATASAIQISRAKPRSGRPNTVLGCRRQCRTNVAGAKEREGVGGWAGNAMALSLASGLASAAALLLTPIAVQAEQTVMPLSSGLPDVEEARAMLNSGNATELFTDDALAGLKTVQEYAEYVGSNKTREAECGEVCRQSRLFLEKVWQVVATEFYDARGVFSQASWTKELLRTLQSVDGVVPDSSTAHRLAASMLSSLGDKYTTFLEPSQFRQQLRRPTPVERAYLAAQYVGLGIQFGEATSDGGRLVEACLPGSPAEEAGIQRGDHILSIDGFPLASSSASKDVLERLGRGLPGTSVDVVIASNSLQGMPVAGGRPLHVMRRELPLPPIQKAVVVGNESTGRKTVAMYIRILYFNSDALKQVEDAIQEGEKIQVDGFIVDVRNDPGGVFEDAVAMSAIFLQDGDMIVRTQRDADRQDHLFRAGYLPGIDFTFLPETRTNRPVAILVNNGSASASEVLTGALKGNNRAVIIGKKTFGKGVVQYFFPMGDGSGMRLTVFKYITPDGVDISRAGGLIPDIQCDALPNGKFANFEELDACERQAIGIIGINRDAAEVALARDTS